MYGVSPWEGELSLSCVERTKLPGSWCLRLMISVRWDGKHLSSAAVPSSLQVLQIRSDCILCYYIILFYYHRSVGFLCLPPAFVCIDCRSIIAPIIGLFNCHDTLCFYFKTPCNHLCWYVSTDCLQHSYILHLTVSHCHILCCSCSWFINHMVQSRWLTQFKGHFEDMSWIF